MTPSSVVLPHNHPYRQKLNDEVHARPPEPVHTPARISHLVCYSGTDPVGSTRQPILDLLQNFGVASPDGDVTHHCADLGHLRVKWELHSEFTSYTFFATGLVDAGFDDPAIGLVPDEWLAALPGQVLCAINIVVIASESARPEYERIASQLFDGNVLVGSGIGAGAGTALTDFRIHADGLSRVWLGNDSMSPALLGRMVQRLLEIETYRMMALLAFPVAQALSPLLLRYEQELLDITSALAGGAGSDEPSLLDRLTRLQAEIESRHSDNHNRFAAANAYYALVQRRITELREERIQGLQTFREFTERRLAPAMDTCKAVSARQNALSDGVARAAQLLSTRVNMTRLEQNQGVLRSMNRRARLQLRLQETIEVLSIGAVTYYIVRLVGYISNGLGEFGLALNTNLTMAASIPLVATLVILVMRRVRRMVEQEEKES